MDGAELDAHHEHDGVRFGGAERSSGAEGGERGETSLETQVVALGARIEAEVPDEQVLGPRREEPGTGGGHDVGDVRCRQPGCLVERSPRRLQQEWGSVFDVGVVPQTTPT
jgi:hypothetical protein